MPRGRSTGRSSCRWAGRWPARSEVDLAGYVAAWQKGLEGVQARGKAEPGDKTMVDVLTPAVEAMEQAGDLDAALRAAVEAAETGMKDTIPLVARKGRASYLGERSKDHQDPGATSTYYLYRPPPRRSRRRLKGGNIWRSTRQRSIRARRARAA